LAGPRFDLDRRPAALEADDAALESDATWQHEGGLSLGIEHPLDQGHEARRVDLDGEEVASDLGEGEAPVLVRLGAAQRTPGEVHREPLFTRHHSEPDRRAGDRRSLLVQDASGELEAAFESQRPDVQRATEEPLRRARQVPEAQGDMCLGEDGQAVPFLRFVGELELEVPPGVAPGMANLELVPQRHDLVELDRHAVRIA
jgi:hypothetical protein